MSNKIELTTNQKVIIVEEIAKELGVEVLVVEKNSVLNTIKFIVKVEYCNITLIEALLTKIFEMEVEIIDIGGIHKKEKTAYVTYFGKKMIGTGVTLKKE